MDLNLRERPLQSGSSSLSTRGVMRRHLLKSKSVRFLLSREWALASYIRESEGAYEQRHSQEEGAALALAQAASH